MSPTPAGDPDLLGYQNAQRRLREKFGRIVKFYTPIAPRYAAGVKLDPETMQPYDPTIKPTASGYAVGSAKANQVYAPFQAIRRDEVQADETGMRSRLNKDLVLDINDAWVASGATLFEVDNEFWTIVNRKNDGTGIMERYLVFGQDTSGDLSDIRAPATFGSDSNNVPASGPPGV